MMVLPREPEGRAHGTTQGGSQETVALGATPTTISRVFPKIWGEDGGCRFSLLSAVALLILKEFHAWEPLEFWFIEYSFSVIKSPREPHFPSS